MDTSKYLYQVAQNLENGLLRGQNEEALFEAVAQLKQASYKIADLETVVRLLVRITMNRIR